MASKKKPGKKKPHVDPPKKLIGRWPPPKDPLTPTTSVPSRTPKQLERDIAASLRDQGQPGLAEMFADPEARRTFAREMRHEIQMQQTAAVNAAQRAARPFTVKHVETIGDRRVRSLVGNYVTEEEARSKADQIGGWVETRDGKIVYGTAEEI